MSINQPYPQRCEIMHVFEENGLPQVHHCTSLLLFRELDVPLPSYSE